MSKKNIDPLVIVVIFSLVLGLSVAWIGGSYFEARAYERITGKSVSTWDAMFIQLRVQEGAK